MYPISLEASALQKALDKISQWASDYKEYLANLEWAQVATVVIAGVFIVLAVLIVLIGIFKGFGSLLTSTEKLAKKRAEKKAQKKAEKKGKQAAQESSASAPVAAPAVVKKSSPAPAPAVQQGISGEVVAAITAAITASEGGAPVSIRSIKVKNVSGRNPWASAAIMDNARPF